MLATAGTLRRLGRTAADEVLAHLLRLSPEDRQRRFGAGVDEAYVTAYGTRLDWRRSILLGWRLAGTLRAVGELKLIGSLAARAAEIAVSVEAPFRGRGLGTELGRRLLVRARNRFVQRVHMLCLLDNRGAKRIARRLGGTLLFHPGEAEALIHLPWPGPLSLGAEWLEETQARLLPGGSGAAFPGPLYPSAPGALRA